MKDLDREVKHKEEQKNLALQAKEFKRKRSLEQNESVKRRKMAVPLSSIV